ncbi:hypothetical protein ACB098_03G088800 [Castanea mollissima]
MLNGSFSLSIFHVVAAWDACNVLSILTSSASFRLARIAIAHTIRMQTEAIEMRIPRTMLFAQDAAVVFRFPLLPSPLGIAGASLSIVHSGNGTPQSPGLFAYWLAGSVVSCPLDGISPVNSLLDRSICTKNDRFEKESGIWPCNLLCDASNTPKSLSWPSDDGISPDNWLWANTRTCKATMFPSSSGILPRSSL